MQELLPRRGRRPLRHPAGVPGGAGQADCHPVQRNQGDQPDQHTERVRGERHGPEHHGVFRHPGGGHGPGHGHEHRLAGGNVDQPLLGAGRRLGAGAGERSGDLRGAGPRQRIEDRASAVKKQKNPVRRWRTGFFYVYRACVTISSPSFPWRRR